MAGRGRRALRRGRTRRACSLVVVGVVLAVVVGAAAAGGAAGATETPSGASAQADGVGFENETYRVVPPETAAVGLTVPDGGLVTVVIEAPGGQFAVEATVAASAAGSGQPVLRLDTGNVSAADPREYLSVENARLGQVTVREHDVAGEQLPGGAYRLRAVSDQARADATLHVAPSATVEFASTLSRADLEREPVRTVTGETGVDPGERLELHVTSAGEPAFRLVSAAEVRQNGTFETTVDLGALPATSRVEVTVHHDGVTRARHRVELLDDLPEPVGGRQTSSGIVFAYEGDQLTLAATDGQPITGETDLAPGSVVTLVLRSPASHLHVVTTTVDRYGGFAVTTDLSGLGPRTDLVVSAVGDGASGAAPVRVVAPEAAASDRGNDTAGALVLGEPSGGGTAGDDRRPLLGGLVALTFGAILSVVAGGLLLGVDASVLSPERE